jgi:hypothetical protein
MFERFTERARQVVVLAQEEARALQHNYIGTEHILLGILREDRGLAAQVLESLGVTPERTREQLLRIVGPGEEPSSSQIPFTLHAKKVLELALRESLSLQHNYIGTEHILLGLMRENEGVALRILVDCDVDLADLRDELIARAGGPYVPQGDEEISSGPGPAIDRVGLTDCRCCSSHWARRSAPSSDEPRTSATCCWPWSACRTRRLPRRSTNWGSMSMSCGVGSSVLGLAPRPTVGRSRGD